MLFTALFFACTLYGEQKISMKEAVITYETNQQLPLAKDLQKHLQIITGEKIPLSFRGKKTPAKGYIFAIGKTPANAEKNLKPEEARWKAADKILYFYGDKELGTSHAVYHFLEEALNVRWTWNNAISAPAQNPIILKMTEGKWTPSLNIRTIRGYKGVRSPWQQRLRHGRHDAPPYGHAFTTWWDKYGKTHPEYFALNFGKRQPTVVGGDKRDVAAFTGPMKEKLALCVSSDAVAERIIQNWGGKTKYINICENDAPDELSCHCKKCCALDELKKGENFTHNLADRYIYFAHNVLKRAKKIRKDARVSMYAYNASQNAPRRERPHKDVVLGIVPTYFDLPAIKEYVGSWKKAGMNEFYYRPNRHFYYQNIVPTGSEEHFFNVFKYMVSQNAIGFDYDAPAPIRYYDAFGDYVIFKGMQDPSKSFAYWEDHYMQAFAPANEEVKAFYAYWRNNVWNKRLAPKQKALAVSGKFYNFARGLGYDLKKYYKDSDFAAAGAYLEKALARKDLSPVVRKLITLLKEENDHVRLIFRAAANKTDKDSLALLHYRQERKMPLFQGQEKYWGDICGIEKVKNLASFTPPFMELPLFWKFRLDKEDAGIKQKWYAENINSWKHYMATNRGWENPHKHYKIISDEIRKQTANYDGIAWYALDTKILPELKGREIFLYFQAVDESCQIYVNGKKVGEHLFVNDDDWRTPFSIRIDQAIDWTKKTQKIVVRVQDTNGQGGIWKRVYIVSKMKSK